LKESDKEYPDLEHTYFAIAIAFPSVVIAH